MTISENKRRLPVTLDLEVWEYLAQRVESEKNKTDRKGQITASTILNELVQNDKKIRDAFR